MAERLSAQPNPAGEPDQAALVARRYPYRWSPEGLDCQRIIHLENGKPTGCFAFTYLQVCISGIWHAICPDHYEAVQTRQKEVTNG